MLIISSEALNRGTFNDYVPQNREDSGHDPIGIKI